jgi:transposase
MKQDAITASSTARANATQTIGLDLGDKKHVFHILDAQGDTLQEGAFPATHSALGAMFAERAPSTVALEAGAQSAWISRALEEWGHEVLVGNPRKLRMIYASAQKCDERDAEMLARIARFDPQLLSPIRHRGARAQSHLALLKSRDALVRTRSTLINFCRGTVKAFGARLRACSADCFSRKVREDVPAELLPALEPVLDTIAILCDKITTMDRNVENLCEEQYPETSNLRAIKGVGPITALAFVLTLEEPERFAKSRAVPVFLGLVPRRDQSGEVDKHLRITKTGDKYLRRLLISCAHYVLGPFGEDCDLRHWGMRLCERGGKNARKRAIVAVARKLSVLLHRLWADGEAYEPLRQNAAAQRATQQAEQTA